VGAIFTHRSDIDQKDIDQKDIDQKDIDQKDIDQKESARVLWFWCVGLLQN